ncbi:Peptidylprolyl isomerase [Psidium guajava]|nr:Peptidylprolyl isomerase [Psidium guajava]
MLQEAWLGLELVGLSRARPGLTGINWSFAGEPGARSI